MTRDEAEAFLSLPDRTRTSALKQLNDHERTEVFIGLLVALGQELAEEPAMTEAA